MAVHIHFHDYRHRDGGPGSGPRPGGGSTVIKPTSTISSEAEHKQRIKTAHSLGVEPEHMYPNHKRRAGDPRLTNDGGPGSGPHKGGGKQVVNSAEGKYIESRAGSGNYKKLGKYSIHKYDEGSQPSLKNIHSHTDDPKKADKMAAKLWEKTGQPHIVRHTQYLDGGPGSGRKPGGTTTGPNYSELEKASAERKRLNETKYKNMNTKPMQNTSRYFFNPKR